MENVAQENEKAISGAIKIDEKEIRTHLDGLVRKMEFPDERGADYGSITVSNVL